MSYEVIPAHLAVEAMRDNGYKNAAYAIAELIDNSIQAGASSVEMLCCERKIQHARRITRGINQIAVLDNGSGMDKETLRIALQFGNGLYLDPSRHTGIGRYGMGLPSSSISQCQRVDVWSWTNGIGKAIHTYLDIEEIKKGKLKEVPVPKNKALPSLWENISKNINKSGTLVVWSKIDRCTWKTSSAIIRHSELLIGRLYRKFIYDKKLSIRMVSFDIDDINEVSEQYATPNDPIYLMENTSCPEPFTKEAMFQPDGLEYEQKYPIDYKGKVSEVKIRFTYAKPNAREGLAPGDKPHGKHAAKNLGISIVRSGRELDMDLSIVNSYDPTERWWGVEVEFPPALDEIFGLTNNKQSARYFSDVLQLDFEEYCHREGLSPTEMLVRMQEEGDPHEHLIRIVSNMKNRLNVIRRILKQQRVGVRSQFRTRKDKAESIATEATRERQNEGHVGLSDDGEKAPIDRRKEEVKEVLEETGTMPETVASILDTTFSNNLKYIFNYADIESPAFFSVKPKGGELIISLNINHPAYDKLFEILEEDTDQENAETLRTHLLRAREGLKLVLMAWARYEDEQPDGKMRERAKQARYDWGIIARQFLAGE
jgi:hypothetical protein